MKAQEYIKKGDTYQIQFRQRFSLKTEVHPFEVYRALRKHQPSPYMYFMDLGDMNMAGASPEMLIVVEDGIIETHPIAGTRRRGRDAEDEARMAEELTDLRKGAGGAHHARRPRSQRPWPGLRARDGAQ